jgi:hypothetical protein
LKEFLVQFGDTTPNGWIKVAAESRHDAVVAGLKTGLHSEARPAVAWVSIGDSRHANGTPIAVEKFGITYKGHIDAGCGKARKLAEQIGELAGCNIVGRLRFIRGINSDRQVQEEIDELLKFIDPETNKNE